MSSRGREIAPAGLKMVKIKIKVTTQSVASQDCAGESVSDISSENMSSCLFELTALSISTLDTSSVSLCVTPGFKCQLATT